MAGLYLFEFVSLVFTLCLYLPPLISAPKSSLSVSQLHIVSGNQ